MKKFGWRRWNTILHRDIGYLIVALTIVYAVSGIAVNHIEDWNPNYEQTRTFVTIPPVKGEPAPEAVQRTVLDHLGLEELPRSSFRPDPHTLQLFFEGRTVSVDLPTGRAVIEHVRQRPVLFEFNQLHLNRPKRLWTYIADLYAVALLIVTVTGMFVLKGRHGITRRGAWLVGLGVLIPAIYWVYYISFP